MARGESNDHVTDDVMWLWKVKVMTPTRLGPNISKTTGICYQQSLMLWNTVGYPSDSLAYCLLFSQIKIRRPVKQIKQESPADAGISARRKNDEKNSSISKL